MPPKQRITREMILERSFAMFSKEGMEAVNARSVAKALNCSTQPIFSYYSGMDDLKTTLEMKAKETFDEAIAIGGQEGDPFVLFCSAYASFAAQQPRLFAHLFLRMSETKVVSFMDEANTAELIEKECAYASMGQEDAKKLFENLTIYTHGLAALLAAGLVDMDQEQIGAAIEAAKASLV